MTDCSARQPQSPCKTPLLLRTRTSPSTFTTSRWSDAVTKMLSIHRTWTGPMPHLAASEGALKPWWALLLPFMISTRRSPRSKGGRNLMRGTATQLTSISLGLCLSSGETGIRCRLMTCLWLSYLSEWVRKKIKNKQGDSMKDTRLIFIFFLFLR